MAILKTEFRGERGALFLLALRLGFLTFLTLGFYRFWSKTRLRRWYWSGVRIGGSPLEYSGTALEKITGFLFALLLLGIVLAAANIAGIAVALEMMAENPDALSFAPIALLLVLFPLFNFARYRSRRYILSRTSWRGIRFGMDAGASGYGLRASIYGFLSLITAGLFLPVRTFLLEKYLTDRTWYGNARFTQHGSPLRLFGPVFPLLLCIWGGSGLMYLAITQGLITTVAIGGLQVPVVAEGGWLVVAVSLACVPLSFLFAVYYRVSATRVLGALKELGDGVEFDVWPKTRQVLRIYVFGSWKTYAASSFVYGAVSGLIWSVSWLFGGASIDQVQAWMLNPPIPVIVAFGVSSYFILTVLTGVFRQTFITQPLVSHVAESVEVHNPELLGRIRQRSLDGRTDAGGFAEALDAGAAF